MSTFGGGGKGGAGGGGGRAGIGSTPFLVFSFLLLSLAASFLRRTVSLLLGDLLLFSLVELDCVLGCRELGLGSRL